MGVSKNACPKAVGRNRINRHVRESFRTQMAGELRGETLDFVVLATAQAANQSNKMLDKSLCAHWHKLTQKATG